MTQPSNSGKFLPESARTRRALPCLAPENTCRITALGSSRQKSCRKRRSCDGAGRIGIRRVRGAGNGADVIVYSPGSCMTWGIWCRPVRETFTSSTRNITACAAANTSRRIWSDYAVPKAQYTHRVVSLAVRLVVEDGLPYQAASWHLWRDHRVFVPFATIQNWVEAGGEKGSAANVDALSRLGPGGLLRVHRGR